MAAVEVEGTEGIGVHSFHNKTHSVLHSSLAADGNVPKSGFANHHKTSCSNSVLSDC